VVLAATGVAAIVAVVLLIGIAEPSVTWPASHTTDEFSGSTTLSFPVCTWVTASWHDSQNRQVLFAFGQAGAASLVSDCRASGPDVQGNCHCPPAWCPTSGPPRVSTGAGPECFENSTGGSLTFFSTQPSYVFFADVANGSTHFSPDPITMNVTEATPLLGSVGALLLGLAGAGASASVAIAGGVWSVRRARRRSSR
jgi:hypothetical protein